MRREGDGSGGGWEWSVKYKCLGPRLFHTVPVSSPWLQSPTLLPYGPDTPTPPSVSSPSISPPPFPLSPSFPPPISSPHLFSMKAENLLCLINLADRGGVEGIPPFGMLFRRFRVQGGQ